MLKSTQSPSKKCKNMGKKQGFIYTNNVFPSPAILVSKNNPQKYQIESEITFPYCPFRGK